MNKSEGKFEDPALVEELISAEEELQQVEAEKAATMKGYNERIKSIKGRIQHTVTKIREDENQTRMDV